MPSTKHIESRMFDFPEPLRPVMALKCGSNLVVPKEDRHVGGIE
jgi:hypothetical protein